MCLRFLNSNGVLALKLLGFLLRSTHIQEFGGSWELLRVSKKIKNI